jgi:hypothetical protein
MLETNKTRLFTSVSENFDTIFDFIVNCYDHYKSWRFSARKKFEEEKTVNARYRQAFSTFLRGKNLKIKTVTARYRQAMSTTN